MITKLRSYQTNKLVMAKQPDKVVVEKQRKMAAAIDLAIPSDSYIREEEHEKLEKCQPEGHMKFVGL